MDSLKVGAAQNEKGFTLIDMLFVIALIGLLSTLAIPGLMRARGAAQSASALGTMKVVNSAQLSFAITCGLGFYSPNFQQLGVTPPSAVDAYNRRMGLVADRHRRAVLVHVHGWDAGTMLDADAVHPNDLGHATIAAAVVRAYRPAVIIGRTSPVHD